MTVKSKGVRPGCQSIVRRAGPHGSKGATVKTPDHYRRKMAFKIVSTPLLKNNSTWEPEEISRHSPGRLATDTANNSAIGKVLAHISAGLGIEMHKMKGIEFGAGLGFLAPYVQRYGVSLLQTDPNAEFVAYNRTQWGLPIKHAGIEDFPRLFKEGEFDFAMGCNTLDTLDPHRLPHMVKAIGKVLKPNGVLVHLMDLCTCINLVEYSEAHHPDRIGLPALVDGYPAVRMVYRIHFQETLEKIGLAEDELMKHIQKNPAHTYFALQQNRPDQFTRLSNQFSLFFPPPFSQVKTFDEFFFEHLGPALEAIVTSLDRTPPKFDSEMTAVSHLNKL